MASTNLSEHPRRFFVAASQLAVMAGILLLGNPSPAWAYVDPGMGSYVFQLTIAAMLAGAYTVRRYYHAILTFVRTRVGRKQDAGPQV